jgi:hypothetical protein
MLISSMTADEISVTLHATAQAFDLVGQSRSLACAYQL